MFPTFRRRYLGYARALAYLATNMTNEATEEPKGGPRKAEPGLRVLERFLPFLWPKGEPGLKLRVVAVAAAGPGLDRRHHARHAARLRRRGQPDDRRHGARRRGRHRPGLRLCGGALRRRAHGQSAQRRLRAGRPGRDAAARRDHLPPPPQSLAALPPRAAHRRGHQDRRARHQEHRHDALFPPLQHRADHPPARHRAGPVLGEVRPRPGRRDRDDGRGLYPLHADGHRLADQAARPDERSRHRRGGARGRQPAQLRDGQIFRRRGARGGSATAAPSAAMPTPRSRTRPASPGSISASR